MMEGKSNPQSKVKHEGTKKQYEVKGKVIGTYNEKTIQLKISLYDDELARIKEIIKSGDCKDLREVLIEEFPKLYETINSKLRSAAYKFYEKEYMDCFAESEEDEPGDIELTGEEYKCPIPEEWR